LTGRSKYYVIDGGSGADQIAATRRRLVDSPRHADALWIIEPVSERLMPAVAEARGALGEPQESKPEPFTIQLPPKEQREMATELAVIAIGPLQRLTAGPLRIVLVCDGEQVVSAEVERGFAARNLAMRFRGLTIDDALDLAASISPLSPAGSRAAFARAVGRAHDEGEVAEERVRGSLWWLVRFADFAGVQWLAERARLVAQKPDPAATEQLRLHVERDRLLRIRFRGVGVLKEEFLRSRGVTGPVLEASARGEGDVLSRMLIRLEGLGNSLTSRGDLAVNVTHDGVHVQEVSWRAPSAPFVDLIPEIVRNERLADAEAIIASLDIATAEVDG